MISKGASVWTPNLTRRHPEAPAFSPAGRGISRSTHRRSGDDSAWTTATLRSRAARPRLRCPTLRDFRRVGTTDDGIGAWRTIP